MSSLWIYVGLYLMIGTAVMVLVMGFDYLLRWDLSHIVDKLKGNRRELAIYLSLPLSWFWLLIAFALAAVFG